MSGQPAEKDDLLTRFTNALDCCGTCAGGVLARYTRERMAQAWAEGYSTCLGDFDISARSEARSPNPHAILPSAEESR